MVAMDIPGYLSAPSVAPSGCFNEVSVERLKSDDDLTLMKDTN
jgi:hypothetical protein